MAVLNASTFLDYCAYRVSSVDFTAPDAVQQAFGIKDQRLFKGDTDIGFNVALVLRRKQDPTTLLSADWASRQRALRELNRTDSLWSTYGADRQTYDEIRDTLRRSPYNLKLLTSQDHYVSSAESRTLWVGIRTQADFQNLFGTPLYYSASKGLYYWEGELNLDATLAAAVDGLWLDLVVKAPASNLAPSASATLKQGAQSIGNAATTDVNLDPQSVGKLYNFPLKGKEVRTGAVGLIEPGVGTYLTGDPEGTQFEALLSQYLETIGQTPLNGEGGVHVQGKEGQSSESENNMGERSLDVGVAAGVNPNSLLCLYNGSGDLSTGTANATIYTAAQSAIWDTDRNPAVTSNSYGDYQVMTPQSPFYNAYNQLFVDAALRNQTTVIALGDGGSGNETANGLTNVEYNVTQPYNLLVGGTSVSNLASAQVDATLTQPFDGQPALLPRALAGDPAILWQLMRSGLRERPSLQSPGDWLLESAWNTYSVDGFNISSDSPEFYAGYLDNSTSSGGVDPSQPTPSYQLNYGLSPVTNDPYAQPGRGAPDVAINAGGNLSYLVPDGQMQGTIPGEGTSAAAPFWASLLTQINLIFNDQGLPNLGYANDLLYTASVLSPGAFNDVTFGNNISSFSEPGPYTTQGTKKSIQPTGFGYQTGPGYDYVSGLGSPNGTLLAIALTNIAHNQMSSVAKPELLEVSGGALVSSRDQSLLFQVSSPVAAPVVVTINGQASTVTGSASGSYAWTSQLAQQSLQEDFDPALLQLFDGYGQGAMLEAAAGSQDALAITVAGSATSTPQINLSNSYGFSDFVGPDATVRAARPLCIATTPGDASNTQAVVRMRQNGINSLALFCYRVDTLTGMIHGLAPGDSGYAEAAQERSYRFSGGDTLLQGGGFGAYSQALLTGVNSGDLIGFGLVNRTFGQTFYGFSQANESVAGKPVNHLWTYGFQTFGFEDTWGGGDGDCNDAIFQLDFSSATGHQYLL